MNRRRRTLPNVAPQAPGEMRPLLAAMKEIIETGEGVRGDPLDRKVTYRDLLDSGIGKLKPGANLGRQGSGGIAPGAEPPPPDMSTPPAPTGFNAEGGFFGNVYLTWSNPNEAYGNHAYTNIYRHTDDNFANAILVGRDVGTFFTDTVRNEAQDASNIPTYYYWITFTSTSGVEGPPHDSSGDPAQPKPDVEVLLETLSENLEDEPVDLGAPDETLILNAKRFAVKVDASGQAVFPLIIANVGGTPTVVIDEALIRQGAIQAGQIGSVSSGTLQLPDGTPITTVGGLLKADGLDVDNIRVAVAAKFDGDVQSGNFSPGSSGWRILQSGNVEFNQGRFNGLVEFDNIDGNNKPADNADVTGDNTAKDTANVAGIAASQVRSGARVGFANSFEPDGEFDEWQTGSSSASITSSSTAFDGSQAAVIRYDGSSDPASSGSTGGVYVPIPSSIALAFGGRRIMVSVYARTAGNNPASEFAVAYSTSDVGNSGWHTFSPTTNYQVFTFFYDVPDPSSGGTDYLGIWGDTSNNGNGVIVDRVSISMVQKDGEIDALNTANGPSQANADRTGDNTAHDTARVAGTSASTVRNRANNGNNAKNRVDDWTRPSTTRIDGNKIYTGDAYVDTLQIKGQAVTFPAGSFSNSAQNVGGWETVQSIGFQADNAPIIITWSLQVADEIADVRLTVNNNVVYGTTFIVTGQISGTAYHGGASTINVRLQARKNSNSDFNPDIVKRGLAVIEAKR